MKQTRFKGVNNIHRSGIRTFRTTLFLLLFVISSCWMTLNIITSSLFLPHTNHEFRDRIIEINMPTSRPEVGVSMAFVDLAHLLEEKESTNDTSNNPPAEQHWLLPSIDHPAPVNEIPHIVNKIYYQKDGKFQNMSEANKNLIAAHKSWPEMNPGYNIRYFNMHFSREYLRNNFHPIFLRTFDCIQAFAGKSDLFRLALLYRDGGWHSDWKQQCLVPNLLDAISSGTDFFAPLDGPMSKGGREKCAQNAFVGARPRHPAVAKAIEKIMRNVQSNYYGSTAWHTTSVCVLGSAILEAGYAIAPDAMYEEKPEGKGRERTYVPKIYWKGEEIIRHKCKDCGMNQSWDLGNNYVDLWYNKKYYCEDASSLFD